MSEIVKILDEIEQKAAKLKIMYSVYTAANIKIDEDVYIAAPSELKTKAKAKAVKIIGDLKELLNQLEEIVK